MGLLELHVDSIDVTTIPKFVLFGGDEREAATSKPTVSVERDRSRLPVSPAKVLAVALGATLLAVALARLSSLLEDGRLQC